MKMKLYVKLVGERQHALRANFKAGKLKQQQEIVKTNGEKVLLWTGSCSRLPKKSSLAKHTKKAGVKRAVLICPPTINHIYTWTLDRKGESMKVVAEKAWIVKE